MELPGSVTPDPTPRFALVWFGDIDFSLPGCLGLHPLCHNDELRSREHLKHFSPNNQGLCLPFRQPFATDFGLPGPAHDYYGLC